jgi:hypothetical protein
VKNWRTTLFGILGACMQSYMGGMNWKSVVSSLPTLAIGYFAKDYSVSGTGQAGKP